MSINPADVLAYSEAATAGPWIQHSPHPLSDSWIEGAKIAGYRSEVAKRISDDRDGNFIANARTDLPALAAFAQEILEFAAATRDKSGDAYVILDSARKHGIEVTA